MVFSSLLARRIAVAEIREGTSEDDGKRMRRRFQFPQENMRRSSKKHNLRWKNPASLCLTQSGPKSCKNERKRREKCMGGKVRNAEARSEEKRSGPEDGKLIMN
jgi:hypothetical protein